MGKIPSFGQRLALLEWDADHAYFIMEGQAVELELIKAHVEHMESEAGDRDRAEREGY